MGNNDNDNDDSEGRLERRIFQELYADWPHADNLEAAMFPILFPHGTGVYDTDRPRPMRFVEYRDHLLRLSDSRFRDDQSWQHWANVTADAIAARRRGENVTLEPPNEETNRAGMDEMLRTTLLEQKLLDPLRIRNALAVMRRTSPAFQYMQDQSLDEAVEERLAEARQSKWSAIKECTVCHLYECPEKNPGLKLSRCSRCLHAYYCGKEHQVSDWKRHKKDCKRLAATLSNN